MYTDAFEQGGIKFAQGKGRELFIFIVIHYSGYSDSERRIFAARNNLSNPFHKKKMTFKFETFSTKLKSTFNTVDKYGQGVYE